MRITALAEPTAPEDGCVPPCGCNSIASEGSDSAENKKEALDFERTKDSTFQSFYISKDSKKL